MRHVLSINPIEGRVGIRCAYCEQKTELNVMYVGDLSEKEMWNTCVMAGSNELSDHIQEHHYDQGNSDEHVIELWDERLYN